MKRLLSVTVATLIGLLIGGSSALWILGNGQLLGNFEKDHWFGNDRAGSTAADPYTRGIIASIGLLALNKSETIYFHRYKDEKGRQLREACAYEMRGATLPTRWWSITVYASDHFLPVNADRAFSADATQIRSNADGTWSVLISRERNDAANWISTKTAGDFSLALRMYNPNEAARDNPASIAFPEIVTISCEGAAS